MIRIGLEDERKSPFGPWSPAHGRASVHRMWRRPPAVDIATAPVGAALTEGVALRVLGLGNPIAGPRPLVLALPLLLDVPLAWRRRFPLAVVLLVLSGIVLQSVVSGDAAEGLELLYAVGFATYSVAAYATRGRAVIGLLAWTGAYTIESLEDRNVRSSDSGQMWSAAFFGLLFVAVWLVGIWVRSRRDASRLAREAETAVRDERARMARELHDIVSHNLSVVVVQAAGARASGGDDTTLEKIERSGREALVEMRRLLGVLRETERDDEPGVAPPQPGLTELHGLVTNVRRAGLEVELTLDERCRTAPPALQLAVYRIVQEALTNARKHSRDAAVQVVLRYGARDVALTVENDAGFETNGHRGGHGLVGMRERVAMFGGELFAGCGSDGGFVVRATLPVGA
jgi:signal transduction histidine kinase